MDLLKKNKRIGTSITLSEKELNFLDLLALRKGLKRSPSISYLIKEKYSQLPKIIKEITDKIWSDWEENTEHDFETYLKLVSSGLHGKNIVNDHIKLIIDELKAKHGKN